MNQTLPRAKRPASPAAPARQMTSVGFGNAAPNGPALPVHRFARVRVTASDPLQRTEAGGEDLATADVSGVVAEGLSGGGRPLDAATRAFMEPRFGHDFSQVRIHDSAQASSSAQAVSARAYTVGSSIAFRSGEFSPGSSEGRRLLAHELTHVVQQGASSPLTAGVQRSLWVSQMARLSVQRDNGDPEDNGGVPDQSSSTDPTNQSSSTDPTNQSSSTDPTNQSSSTDPTNQSSSTDPTNQSSSTDPTNQSSSTDPTQSTDPKDNSGDSDSTLIAGAALIPPSPGGGNQDCLDLVQKMLDFVNGGNGIKRGLAERFEDMMQDASDLYNKFRFKSNPGPGGLGSWEGHQEQYEGQRTGLNNRIKNYKDNNCDDRGGPGIPVEVQQWTNQPAPVQPRNAPSTPRTSTDPSTQPDGSGVSWGKVVEVLAILGLSAALVVGVIAALADPEPATKLGAIGLDAAMAAKLMQMLGMAPA